MLEAVPDTNPLPIEQDPFFIRERTAQVEQAQEQIPLRYRYARMGDLPESLRNSLPELGTSLMLWGDVGTGKSYAAAAIALNWVYDAPPNQMGTPMRRTVRRLVVAEVLDLLRPSTGQLASNVFAEAKKAGMLILEDIGVEKASEWTQERLYTLINHRYEHMKPIIVTSNKNLEELEEQVGTRTTSRIAEMCTGVTLKGKDRRINQ